MMARLFRILFLFMLPASALAQCPDASFSLPAAACLSQNLLPAGAAGAVSWSWDFCSGDLLQSPTPTAVASSGNLFRARSVRAVKANGSYFVFAVNEPDGKMSRLDFDNSLSNTP